MSQQKQALRAVVNPTPANTATVHTNAALTDFSAAYENAGFHMDHLLPVMSTGGVRSGTYYKYARRDTAHIPPTLMGPTTPAPEGTYSLSTGTFLVADYGRKQIVARAMQANADPALDPLRDASAQNMQELLLDRESRGATVLFTAANYSGNTSAVSTPWTTESTSTPIADINTAIAAIPYSGSDSRRIAFCCRSVWNSLRKHPALLAMKGITGQGQVSRAEFAAFFELDDILVSDVKADTNNLGQDPTYSYLYTSTMFGIIMVPKALTTRSKAFGVTFRTGPVRVDSWYDQNLGVQGSDVVVSTFSEQIATVCGDQGYLLTSVN